MIPVFCINLKRAEERRLFMETEWTEKRGIPLNFFDAVDRRYVENEDFVYKYPFSSEDFPKDIVVTKNHISSNYFSNNKKKYNNPFRVKLPKFRPRRLFHSEICVLNSHLMLIKQIIDSGIEEAIILEDDAEPLVNSSVFFETINLCKEYAKNQNLNMNILSLAKPRNGCFCYSKNNNFSVLSRLVYGMEGYYYSRKGLILMYEQAKKMYYPIDSVVSFGLIEQREFNIVNTPLLVHLNTTTYNIDCPGRRFRKKGGEMP